MKMKGIELPVNSVIVIALAIMVLLMIAAFLMGGLGPMSSTDVENAWTQGCSVLKNTHNCDRTKVDSLQVVDVTGDGIADNMLTICRAKFNDQTLTGTYCRNKCCTTVIQEGSECENDDDRDCRFGFGTGNWVCDAGFCCPSDRPVWNAGTGMCE